MKFKNIKISLIIFFTFLLSGCASFSSFQVGHNIYGKSDKYSHLSGTPVRIVAANPIQSYQGMTAASNAAFVINNDVVDKNGKLIIKKDEFVTAKVSVRPKGGAGRPGIIKIEFIGTRTVDGNPIYFDSEVYKLEGESNKGTAIGLTISMFFIYPPFNFFHLIQNGKDITMQGGSQFLTRIR